MAIELDGVSWTFGTFTFQNVVIVRETSFLRCPRSYPHLGRQYVVDGVVHKRADELQQCRSRLHLDAHCNEFGCD
jgi:hypothetical protein